MERLSDQGRLRPWMGFVLFGVLMAFFILVCAPLQQNLGIPGLVITELAFLAMAVIYCLITRVKIKEVFPVKKVKVRDIFGCILLILGAFPVSMIAVAITGTIFPQSVSEVGDLNSFLYESMSFPVAVLVVALLPAICEEAIHRGAILSNFRSLKHDWVIVLIMGLLFGINHMSVLRFLTTMFLGLILSYVVVKKNNILLSMIMHFTNNMISVTVTYLGKSAVSEVSVSNIDYSSLLGTYLIMGIASPFIITLGLMLLYPQGHKKIRFLYAGILSAVMLVSGIAMTAVTASKNMLVNSTASFQIEEENKESELVTFDVEKDRSATIVVVVTNAEGDYKIKIDGDKGSSVIDAEVPDGMLRTLTYNVDLKADHYKVTVVPGSNSKGEHPAFQIVVQ